MMYVLEIPNASPYVTNFFDYEYFVDYKEVLTRIKVLKLQRNVDAKIVGYKGDKS